jgi:hypothetical protein
MDFIKKLWITSSENLKILILEKIDEILQNLPNKIFNQIYNPINNNNFLSLVYFLEDLSLDPKENLDILVIKKSEK